MNENPKETPPPINPYILPPSPPVEHQKDPDKKTKEEKSKSTENPLSSNSNESTNKNYREDKKITNPD